MNTPIWVAIEVVTSLHKKHLAVFGGKSGIRDLALLESALSLPINIHMYDSNDPDLAKLAAAYAFGLTKNHPFIDGNKRTSLLVCELFLALNGFELLATEEEKYEVFMGLASNQVTEREICAWIAMMIRKEPSSDPST